MIRFFICGSALRGQPDHATLQGRFVGARTAPMYRMHSIHDKHPGVYFVEEGGVSLAGEVYEMSNDERDALLAVEPPDLYEGTIVLEDGTTAHAMVYSRSAIEQHGYPDVSHYGGWAAFKSQLPNT